MMKILLAAALAVVSSAFADMGEYWARNRISRCPTAPIKRPPDNRDELLEPTDYYTDEFLS